MPDTSTMSPIFTPSVEEAKARERVYRHFETMRQVKTEPLPNFANGDNGNVGWLSYIDRAERFLNGYVLTRSDQGKEEWQSNLMDNTILAKARAIAAGVGLRVPDMAFTATNKDGIRSNGHADIMKNSVQTTFKLTNPTLHTFLEVWQLIAHGTIFEYEGYKTGGAKMPRVESFDTLTGKVNVKMEYVKFDGKPFSVIINPQEFYWWSMKIRDIQQQPRLAWVQHYTKRELEAEFSKYPNYKYVLSKSEASKLQLDDTTYFQAWNKSVSEDNDYEIVRMYSKEDDGTIDGVMGYEVWANGIPLLRAPLLWGEKEKIYPFAKQILQPFANTNFFVGMPLAAMLEAYQQGKSDLLNTLIDKLYRGVNPQKLVGLENKDLLETEASIYSQDNTVYVPDINKVKFMEHPQINQGELMMFKILEQGIESSSVDRSQQGLSSTVEKTLGQARLEDARARELKGSLYLSLEDLWLQKTKLRTEIILTHYLKDKAAQENTRDQIITVKDYTFGDGTRGTLDIHVAKNKASLIPLTEIQAREQAMEQQGEAYKLISVTQDYLDDWMFDIEIIPQSFHNQDQTAKEEDLMAEIQQVGMVDPAFLMANKDHYTEQIIELHGHHMDEYQPAPAMPPMMPPMQPGQENQPAQPSQAPSVLGLQ